MGLNTQTQVILASEANREQSINRATGEAEAVLRTAAATAKGLDLVSRALAQDHGSQAASLRVAEKYIEVRMSASLTESRSPARTQHLKGLSGSVLNHLAIKFSLTSWWTFAFWRRPPQSLLGPTSCKGGCCIIFTLNTLTLEVHAGHAFCFRLAHTALAPLHT